MVQAVSRRPYKAKAQVYFQAGVCGICGGRSGTGTRFALISTVLSCHCHYNKASYSFVHLIPTLYNLSIDRVVKQHTTKTEANCVPIEFCSGYDVVK
jgi:hypothetical protein